MKVKIFTLEMVFWWLPKMGLFPMVSASEIPDYFFCLEFFIRLLKSSYTNEYT